MFSMAVDAMRTRRFAAAAALVTALLAPGAVAAAAVAPSAQASVSHSAATSGYSGSASNLAQVSLATDMVFSDGVSLELPSVTGSVAAGYALALTVGVSA